MNIKKIEIGDVLRDLSKFFTLFITMSNHLSLNNIPKELFLIILGNFSLKKLLDFGLVSTHFLSVVKNTPWSHVMPLIGSVTESMYFFVENYKFRNYAFKGMFVTNDNLKKFGDLNLSQITIDNCPLLSIECLQFFKNCDTITINWNIILDDSHLVYFLNYKKIIINSWNRITTNGLKILEKCQQISIHFLVASNIINQFLLSYNNLHTIRLSGSTFVNRLTIECSQYLSNIKNLDLRVLKITDEHIQYFTNCCYLNLSLTKIKGTTLHLLKNLHTVILNHCKITDNIVKTLGKLNNVSLCNCCKITDNGVSFLKNLCELNLKYCHRITDTSVKMLTGLHKLNIAYCRQVTDQSVKLLTKLHTLVVDGCTELTNQGLCPLKNSHLISIVGCYKITLKRSNIVYDRSYSWNDELFR